MKLRTWIFWLIVTILLVYVNVWFDHMGPAWNQQWWYLTTQVIGIIANIVTALHVVIPGMVWFEEEFGGTL